MGLFEAAGHSPNHVALATRKVCQNDEILDSFATPFRPFRAVDKAPTQPYLCPTGQWRWRLFGGALVVEPWIAEFPLIWRMFPDRGGSRDASQ
jgi:hypothetical protein